MTAPVRHRMWWRHTKVWLPQVVATMFGLVLAPAGTGFHAVIHDGPFRGMDPESGPLVAASVIVVDSILPIALASTIVLVLVGTLEFVIEAKASDAHTKAAKVLTMLSIALAVLWALALFTTDARLQALAIGHGVEAMAAVIFLLFLLIDWLFLLSLKKRLAAQPAAAPRGKGSHANHSERESLLLKREFIVNSILFVDVPVLIGIGIIYGVSVYVDSQPVFFQLTSRGASIFSAGSDTQRHALVEVFLRGLTTGALVMHVAFSQMVFGFIKMRDIRARAQKGLLEDVYV